MMRFEARSDFDFQSAEYQDLFRRSAASPFQHPDWLTGFYRHCVRRPDVEPLVIVGRMDAAGALAFVAPLLKRRTPRGLVVEYAFLGLTDYACVVMEARVAAGIPWPELRERFAGALGPHDLLRIEPVRPADAASWEAVLGIPAQTLSYGAHAVRLGSPFRDWRKRNMGTARAAALDRKARRLGATGGLRLDIVPAAETTGCLAQARAFRAGRFTDDPMQDGAGFRFYCEVASRGARSGLARTYRLSTEERTVAVVFGLVQDASFFYLLLGCDYAAFARHSPGLVALDQVMAGWAEDGGEFFDFTIGDEPFKAEFGCRRTAMLHFIRPATPRGEAMLKR